MDQPTFLIYDPSVSSAYSLLSPWPPSLPDENVDRPVLNPPLGRPLPSYNYVDRTLGTFASARPFQRAIFSNLALFNAWIAQLWTLPPETGTTPSPIIVMGRDAVSRGIRLSRSDIYRRALASFNTPAPAVATMSSATSLLTTPSLLLPNLGPTTASLLGPRTPLTTVGNPIILIYDPTNVYTEYESSRKNIPINEELSLSCSATFRPCPGIRRGIFTDLALFNAWLTKIWGLPPESGAGAPIVVLGRRDVTRGGAKITSRDMEIRADANFATDPDTNTRPTLSTPTSAPGGGGGSGGSTPAAPTTNNTPVWGGTIQLFSLPGCGFCTAAMNYLTSIGVPAERIEITSASDPRLVSALARAGVSVRGGFGTPLIIHTKGTPRLTQGFNAADLRARYFESSPSAGRPVPLPGADSPDAGTPTPDTSTPETSPPPSLPVFTSTFVGPLTYSFATEGTAARSWSFGDGGVSLEPNPTHTYTSPGTYTVGLRMPADSENVATATLNVLAAGTPGTITSSAPAAVSKGTPFPFLVGAGVMYGVYSLWRRLRS